LKDIITTPSFAKALAGTSSSAYYSRYAELQRS
jgi:hypothetical protein